MRVFKPSNEPEPDGPRASTICGRCRGTGTETRDRARREKDDDGRWITVTEPHVETCRMCNGYGEYPRA